MKLLVSIVVVTILFACSGNSEESTRGDGQNLDTLSPDSSEITQDTIQLAAELPEETIPAVSPTDFTVYCFI